MKKVLFWLGKQVLFLVLWIFPTEAFIRLVPFLPGRFVTAGLCYYGAAIDSSVRFAPPVTFHGVSNYDRHPFRGLTIDEGVYIGRHVFLDCEDEIHIGANATLAMGVMILTHTNPGNSPLKDTLLPVSKAPVKIGRGAYLGARALVLQGVDVGEGAVIAAGALVNRDVPAGAVVGGVPARVISHDKGG